AEKAAEAHANGGSPFFIAQAGTLAWRQLGNLMRARTWFERLAAVAPEHPSLRAFEAQIGQKLSPAHMDGAPVERRAPQPVAPPPKPQAAPPPPQPVVAPPPPQPVVAPPPPQPAYHEEPPPPRDEPRVVERAPEPVSGDRVEELKAKA